MHCGQLLAALAGIVTLVTAAPTSADQDPNTPSARGLRYRTRSQRRSPQIGQSIPLGGTITTIGGLNAASQLALLAEQQLLAQVQTELALATQLELIKNTIRVNSFQARLVQTNAVLVTVTNVIDARDPQNVNTRYLLNQLHVDNGFPNQEVVIMMTQAQDMTIGPTATATPLATNNRMAASSVVSGFASPTGGPAAPVSRVASFNPNVPFSSWLNQSSSLLLPYGTLTPTGPLIVDDPANIIFPNQGQGMFVESLATFQTDCLQLGAQVNPFVVNGGVFSSIDAALAAQLAGLQLGSTLPPTIPPEILASNPALALAAAAAAQQQGQAAGQFQGQDPFLTNTFTDTFTDAFSTSTTTDDLIESSSTADFDSGSSLTLTQTLSSEFPDPLTRPTDGNLSDPTTTTTTTMTTFFTSSTLATPTPAIPSMTAAFTA